MPVVHAGTVGGPSVARGSFPVGGGGRLATSHRAAGSSLGDALEGRRFVPGTPSAGDALAACAGQESSPSMAWAGTQQGEYTMEVVYKHVGEGAGEFNVVTEKLVNYRLVKGISLIAVVFLVVVALALFAVPRTAVAGGLPLVAAAAAPAELEHDCRPSLANAMLEWSSEKQVWCCRNAAVGCSAAVLATAAAPASASTLLRAQPSAAPPPRVSEAECRTGLEKWEVAWSKAKQALCCDQYGTGCPTTTPLPTTVTTTRAPYDCFADVSNWAAGWSVPKQEWCCNEFGRGCPDSEGAYDCSADSELWRTAWSAPKQGWCCHYAGNGCG